jgi:hypothetical protein
MPPSRRVKCHQTRYPDPKPSTVHQTWASPPFRNIAAPMQLYRQPPHSAGEPDGVVGAEVLLRRYEGERLAEGEARIAHNLADAASGVALAHPVGENVERLADELERGGGVLRMNTRQRCAGGRRLSTSYPQTRPQAGGVGAERKKLSRMLDVREEISRSASSSSFR